MCVLCISFTWYLKKNFLEMFATYGDNKTGKTHHSSSRTHQGMPSHAILEGIMGKKTITHSNLLSLLTHSKHQMADENNFNWHSANNLHNTASKWRFKETKQQQKWASQVLHLGLEMRDAWVPIDTKRLEWLVQPYVHVKFYVKCHVYSYVIWPFIYLCL